MAENEAKVKKSELLRTKIYRCAIDLFQEKGFDSVKISDICEKAEISTGTFYYYFPSKEAVFLEYARVADEMMDELSQNIKCDSYSERLRLLIRHKVLMFSVVGQKLGNVCLVAFLKHNDDSFMDIQRSAYANFSRVIEAGQAVGEFRKDLDPGQVSSTMRYAICGLALHWCCSQESFDIEAEAEKQAEEFVRFIRA